MVLVTVLFHHATTAALILVVILLARATAYSRATTDTLALLLLIGAAAYIHSGPLFDGNERIAHYQKYFEHWPSLTHILIGVGPGTFMWSAMVIDQYKPPVFFQMHSDWLQILWELGLVGLGLCLWVWVKALALTWQKDFKCALGLVGLQRS